MRRKAFGTDLKMAVYAMFNIIFCQVNHYKIFLRRAYFLVRIKCMSIA